MKREVYTFPKSSFLSVQKDTELIVSMIMKNDRLKNMLYYTTKDCLNRPKLNEDQTLDLFGKQIKIIPKLEIDSDVKNYLIVTFNNFVPNVENPEFRDNSITFDIICHYDQWQMKDFQLRPYLIAAELDTMFNGKHLTGIGELEFVTMRQIGVSPEFCGLSMVYYAIHGGEDKKGMPNPADDQAYVDNFDAVFNNK